MDVTLRLALFAYWLALWFVIVRGMIREQIRFNARHHNGQWQMFDVVFIAVWPLFGALVGVMLTGLIASGLYFVATGGFLPHDLLSVAPT